MQFKPRFSAVPQIVLPAEGCGCLAEGLRFDCDIHKRMSRSIWYPAYKTTNANTKSEIFAKCHRFL